MARAPKNSKFPSREELDELAKITSGLVQSSGLVAVLMVVTCFLAPLWWYWSTAPLLNSLRRFIPNRPRALVKRSQIYVAAALSGSGLVLAMTSTDEAGLLKLAARLGIRVSSWPVALLPFLAPVYLQAKLNQMASLLDEHLGPKGVSQVAYGATKRRLSR